MEFIQTNKEKSYSVYYIKSDCGTGGFAQIVDSNYDLISEEFGHTKKVAIQRAKEILKNITNKNKTK